MPADHTPTEEPDVLKLYSPLRAFGTSFKVRLSGRLVLSPWTVLEASSGLSLPGALKKAAGERAGRDFVDALSGRRHLSTTSIAAVARAFGPADEAAVASVLKNKRPPPEVDVLGDWDLVLHRLPPLPETDPLLVFSRCLAQFERLSPLHPTRKGEATVSAGVDTLTQLFPDSVSSLDDFPPSTILLPGFVAVETALLALANAECTQFAVQHITEPTDIGLLRLLRSDRKPIGHWLQDVCDTLGCRNFVELANLLLRSGAKLRGKAISHDSLKGWASLKAGMLMSWAASGAVLSKVVEEDTLSWLRARFALARFLTFLADLMRSSTTAEPATFPQAQELLYRRYRVHLHRAAGRAGNVPDEVLEDSGEGLPPQAGGAPRF
jgi:hypothetical protein